MNLGLLLLIEEGAVTSNSSEPYCGVSGPGQNMNEQSFRRTVCTKD